MTKKTSQPLGKEELHKRIDALEGFHAYEKKQLKKEYAKRGWEETITEKQFNDWVRLRKAAAVEERLFEERGYRYPTVAESWEAARKLSDSLNNLKLPPMDVIEWYTAAVERCAENDAPQLIRELGLFVPGRPRRIDPQLAAIKVKKLIDAGDSIMDACQKVAEKLECSVKTTHRWYNLNKSSI